MIVLVDTDVLIDVALDRAPFADASCALLDVLERRPGTGFIAWHSLSNFFYLVSPKTGKVRARDFLLELLRFVAVAPTTTTSFLRATSLDMPDLEGAMQAAAALACNADVIATRNLDDFKRSPVRASSPAKLVDEIQRV